MPILAKFFLWFGAISPIPEIWIATDEKLAKPDSAKVAIIKLFSEITHPISAIHRHKKMKL